ncbi:MAG: CDP-tyvelose-2-epimerase (CDP-paratose 2-epimerase)-like protein [Labilithrix sp.]|nr:CDP-tyvelose-2-epimerase (CDP-paratose 2-epimerase)-like protein [Labilithrix sp.]
MTVLVTGGAGFIGSNVVHRLVRIGERVRILDNLSRPGVEKNVEWLRECHGDGFELIVADVRDAAAVATAVDGVDHVFHFAAQVAVTTSLDDPRNDFAVNGLGTLNVLEAARQCTRPPSILYTSTNKVYGALEDVRLESTTTRYEPADHDLVTFGVGENRALEFHSPYGCSKGTADQYVLDYARTYGLSASVFRMSCIYGPRQFGNEDQGWLAHFLIRALRSENITIYGDGRQVRDVLFVEDLVDAMIHVRGRARDLAGRVFNVGGGPSRTLSLVELVDRIEHLMKQRPSLTFEPWRLADQRWYVSDPRALERAVGWRPHVGIEEGVSRLYDWLVDQPENSSTRNPSRLEVAS